MATGLNINNRGNIASDPIRNFRFVVQFLPLYVDSSVFDPKPYIGFTSVSGLAIATESIPYREGGYNTTVHQIPGQTTFSPVTFQRGVSIGQSQHWDWMKMLFQTVTGTDINPKTNSFRCDIVVNVLNHPVPYSTNTKEFGSTSNENQSAEDDVVVARFRLYNAWPTSVAYSDLNAGDNALMVEQMTVVHEGMTVDWAKYNGADKVISPL